MITSSNHRRSLVRAHRLPQIDAIKGVSILAVVLIHALRPRWVPEVSRAEIWLGDLTRFAVPGFLFASGFLYATTARAGATTAGRLRRVLLPYLVASLAASLFWAVRGGTPGEPLWHDLLLGSSFGPYYYVFVLTVLVLATPLIARLGPSWLAALTTAAIGGQWFIETEVLGPMDPFWKARNPLLWWGYFLAGWVVRRSEPQIGAVLQRHRNASITLPAVAFAILAVALAIVDVPSLLQRTLAWVAIWATIAFLYAVWSQTSGPPRWLRWLSDATYAIYLLHLFFVVPAQEFVARPMHAFDVAAVLFPWLAGVSGSIALIVTARAVLGRHSHDVVGA